MTVNGWIQIALFCVIIVALTKPLGGYMTRVFAGERTFLVARAAAGRARALPAVRRRREGGAALDDLCGRHAGLQPRRLRARSTRCSGCRACCRSTRKACRRSATDLAFNTAVSFVTNTNWQSYVRRNDDELSHADGRADGAQLRLGGDRHRARRRADPRLRPPLGARRVGNFWVDLTRCTLYVLLPISIVVGAVLRLAGHAAEPRRLRRARRRSKAASRRSRKGPVASQEAIKMLGTNGGGFFNANSAHPFENPTPLTNLVQMVLIFVDRRGAHQRLRPHGRATSARAGRSSPRWACCSWPACASPIGPRPPAIRRSPRSMSIRSRATAVRRQHGRQGGPLRHRQLRAVRRHHDGRLLRRGQRHA